MIVIYESRVHMSRFMFLFLSTFPEIINNKCFFSKVSIKAEAMAFDESSEFLLQLTSALNVKSFLDFSLLCSHLPVVNRKKAPKRSFFNHHPHHGGIEQVI